MLCLEQVIWSVAAASSSWQPGTFRSARSRINVIYVQAKGQSVCCARLHVKLTETALSKPFVTVCGQLGIPRSIELQHSTQFAHISGNNMTGHHAGSTAAAPDTTDVHATRHVIFTCFSSDRQQSWGWTTHRRMQEHIMWMPIKCAIIFLFMS